MTTTASKTKTPAKPAQKPATSEFTFTVEESAVDLKSARTAKPNPLLGALQQSLDTGKTLQIPVSTEEQAAEAEALLRRAAKSLECGMSLRVVDGKVVFKAKSEKRKRAYTVERVREWGKENGATDDMLYPKISADVLKAFRVEHGYEKADAKK